MYPDEQIVTLIYFMCKTIIVVPICLIAETKSSAWTLRPDIALVTIVLSGFFGPSFSSLLHTWGLHLKGTLYISIFKPFSIVVAAAFGVIFLGDTLCLGSVVGAIILLLGFYAVIWGKAHDEDTEDCGSDNLRASSDGKTLCCKTTETETTGLPPLKPPIIYRIVLLSLIGYGGNICAFKGIEYSSPTLASAISNLPPAFTFILAVVFRMEKLDFRSSSTIAKTVGTILSVSGALIAILYNGPVILSPSSSPSSPSLEYPLQTPQTNWVLGGLLLAAFCILVSVWYILQTNVIRLYPAELTVVVLFSLCTSISAAIVSFVVETNTSAWSLRTDLALITIVIFAFFGPTFSAAVHTWGQHLKGPVYVAIFRPISIVIAAAMGVLILGDVLHLGSVIGATILLLGFYAVIWGKANEEIMNKDSDSESPGASSDRSHLLSVGALALSLPGASHLLLPSDAVDVVAAVRGGSDFAAEGPVLDDAINDCPCSRCECRIPRRGSPSLEVFKADFSPISFIKAKKIK
ncbi:hypothetical protein TIFTF001_039794 [Ficus carica]|nr:hypothetical protein TIFTF001_039794 [Ficus carica]